MSHGRAETDKLISNVQAQLNKLLTQLSDLDELRAELDDEEYEETRRETLAGMEVRRVCRLFYAPFLQYQPAFDCLQYAESNRSSARS
jgi:hypothetical protein